MNQKTFFFFAAIYLFKPLISIADNHCDVDSDVDNTDVVMMLDGSGSIQGYATTVKNAAKGLLDHLIDEGAALNVAIGSFGSSATINAPLSTDYNALKTVVDSLPLGNMGGTNASSAISVSQTEVASGSHDSKIIIFLSDGLPDSASTARDAATSAKALGTRIITIGVNLSWNTTARAFLAAIATEVSADDQNADGGSLSAVEQEAENEDGDNYFIADNGASLDAVFESIAGIILNLWYADNDGDDYGNPSSSVRSCEQPDDYVADNTDCDDTDATISPDEEEICDGIDNNCDGRVDEDLLNSCGSCGPVPEEICDGTVDDNCNGTVDEGCQCTSGEQRPCGSDVGECQEGAQTCSEGNWSEHCEGEITATDEICDDLDNDCDGEVDEGVLNACGTCGPVPEEICDGIDSNCDGSVDEDLLNSCGGCGPVPEEICDGTVDDNCNGTIDEGCQCSSGEQLPCGSDAGECQEGVQTCVGGIWNEHCEGQITATEEVCDDLDNDCNGIADEECAEEEVGTQIVNIPPVMALTGGIFSCSLANNHGSSVVHIYPIVLFMGFLGILIVMRLKIRS